MKLYRLEEQEYKLVENYRDGFDYDALVSRYTDYFDEYDYLVGDWAYGKLRLKGFCKPENKKCNKINHIRLKQDYIKKMCAYDCKYFMLEKI